jgi:hypothetical protein
MRYRLSASMYGACSTSPALLSIRAVDSIVVSLT